MTLQFGSGVAQTFTSAPTAGTPSIAIGNGTFSGGAAPDFQGVAALGVNMAAGYADNLLDLQLAGVSKLKVDCQGTLTTAKNLFVTGGGALFTSFIIAGDSNAGVFLSLAQAGWSLTNRDTPSNIPFSVVGMALQTGDLLSVADSTPTKQFGIANAGTGVAPVWALRVAPTTNAASMAQAHVAGADAGLGIQVIDNAGATVGWIQLSA